MTATANVTPPMAALLGWLGEEQITYHVHPHSPTFTARATALAEGVDPRTFAKAIVVRDEDGRLAMVVLDATDQLDLKAAERALDLERLRLVTEDQLRELAPDCDLGTMPPIPTWGMPIYADRAVQADEEISFHAGSHAYAVRVDRAGWERAAGVVYADLVRNEENRIWRSPTDG